jgi:hypothetical protein
MKAAPDSFLKTLGAYLEAQNADHSANQPVLLGTVDSGYTTGLPRVKFDGESVTSDKVFAILGSYGPVANDRVALIPVGTTYLIVGKVTTSYTPPSAPAPATQSFAGAQFTSTITITNTNQDLMGNVNVSTTKTNTQGLLVASFDVELSGTAGDVFEGQALIDGVAQSGKVHSSSIGRNNVSRAWAFTLSGTGTHTFKLQALKVNNGSTVVTYATHTGLSVIVGDM